MAEGFFRSKKGFTVVQNEITRDVKISLKAKGLYLVIQAYISMPDKKWTKEDFRNLTKEGKKAFDSAFAKYDMILTPAAPTTAPKLGVSLSDPIKMYLGDIYTISVNLAGLPGISIPVGQDAKGLPVGMQLIGDCFQEKKLFQAAYTYECLTEKKWVSMYDKTGAAGKEEA